MSQSYPEWEAGELEYPRSVPFRYSLRAAPEVDTAELGSDREGDGVFLLGETDRTQMAPATLGILPRTDSTFKCLWAETPNPLPY